MGHDTQLRYHVTLPEGVRAGGTLRVVCEEQICVLPVPRLACAGDTLACAPAWLPTARPCAPEVVTIHVPPGVQPGQEVVPTTPRGSSVRFVVPSNLPPSRWMQLSLPRTEEDWEGHVSRETCAFCDHSTTRMRRTFYSCVGCHRE